MAYQTRGKRLSFGRTLSDGVDFPGAEEKSVAVLTSGGDRLCVYAY